MVILCILWTRKVFFSAKYNKCEIIWGRTNPRASAGRDVAALRAPPLVGRRLSQPGRQTSLQQLAGQLRQAHQARGQQVHWLESSHTSVTTSRPVLTDWRFTCVSSLVRWGESQVEEKEFYFRWWPGDLAECWSSCIPPQVIGVDMRRQILTTNVWVEQVAQD